MAEVSDYGFGREALFDLNSRLRTLESRHKDLRQLVNLLRENLQEIKKNLIEEIRESGQGLRGLEKRINNFENILNALKNEIELRAPKEEFDIIKKYLEYWNPANFVTVDMLDKKIKELKKH